MFFRTPLFWNIQMHYLKSVNSLFQALWMTTLFPLLHFTKIDPKMTWLSTNPSFLSSSYSAKCRNVRGKQVTWHKPLIPFNKSSAIDLGSSLQLKGHLNLLTSKSWQPQGKVIILKYPERKIPLYNRNNTTKVILEAHFLPFIVKFEYVLASLRY